MQTCRTRWLSIRWNRTTEFLHQPGHRCAGRGTIDDSAVRFPGAPDNPPPHRDAMHVARIQKDWDERLKRIRLGRIVCVIDVELSDVNGKPCLAVELVQVGLDA